MDIPKQPAQHVHTSSASLEASARRSNLLSDIDALNLQPGKQYPARVVLTPQTSSPSALSSTATSSANQAAAEPGETSDKAASAGRTPVTPAEAKADAVKLLQNEYLLRVNAKTILITSEKQLAIGDKLFVSVDSNMPSGKPSLIARMLEPLPPPTQTQSAATPTSVITSQGNQNPATLNSQQITQLLQALNLTLDKQITLQEGFRNLASLLPEAAETENRSDVKMNAQTARPANAPDGQIKIEALLRQLVHQQILSALPRSADIVNSQALQALGKPELSQQTKPLTESQTTTQSTLSSNSAAGAVKTALLNSGLFMENTLLSHPDKLVAFKAQLESLQTNLQQISHQANLPTTGNTATLQKLGNSLHKIQQTIDQLIHNTSKISPAIADTPNTQTPNESKAALSDLKASLLSLAAHATRQLAQDASAEALKNLFLLPVTEDYKLSPFAFPLLSAAQASSARSLFDKQEFNTGQLLKLLAGMIHRLQFNQLHSLLQSNSSTDAAPAQQSWFFELPVINPQQQIHSFNFRIDKEAQSGSQPTTEEEKAIQWKLLLSFDLEPLGPVYVQVKFLEHVAAATPSISSVLWADKAETLNLLKSEAEQFRKSLEDLGLNVTELRCEQGQPNQTKTRLDRHLVDTRA